MRERVWTASCFSAKQWNLGWPRDAACRFSPYQQLSRESHGVFLDEMSAPSLLGACLAFTAGVKPLLRQRIGLPLILATEGTETAQLAHSPESFGMPMPPDSGLDPLLVIVNFALVVSLSAAGAVAAAFVVQQGLQTLLPARDDEKTRKEFRDAANTIEYESQWQQLDRIRWKQLPGPVLSPDEMQALGVQLSERSAARDQLVDGSEQLTDQGDGDQ